MFRRLGRAMLRPIFAQQYNPLRGGRLSPLLQMALRWWDRVLEQQLCEQCELVPTPRPKVELFCDASGQPPVLAAVMHKDGITRYTFWDVPSQVLEGLTD